MDTITVDIRGKEYQWAATLVGYGPGPVVQIELCVEPSPVYCARIFPPYHATEGAWLQTLPPERLPAGVLSLFADGKLEVTPLQLLELYEDFTQTGILKVLPHGAPLCVHPRKSA